ncbi:apolipoprotein N-acyltransferase [Xylanimonas cellulosilytica DSM 15894]|uniref:Apolipoprotein N-acyltransferase n=1 Tax=Xylanimonas cellulosilytica (strain DSM 15894 / JCM 12276 / CECT 5975 / KCTC 9989 / LMG 20990 / NBRC 107835 / XIL07) TaxID=446471 RepID=D1BSV3_XYLCX|nr:apolipoprotein N-acyltransferase [Xylanimonas cellulosilytica]ACZ30795.1 apolipoprotein N-acyltransferase [Xylanimonas cellulosilytica DSM 15894]
MPRSFLDSRPAGLLLAPVAGATLWAAFPDAGIWPLTVVAVAVLHLALRRDHAGWGFLVGLVAGLSFFLPHVWWAYYATAPVPWLALSLLGALGFATFGAAWTWARRLPAVRHRPVVHVLAFATVWVAVEQWRSEVPWGGFPWGRLGWSVAGAPTGRAAWLGGVPLVSFLLAATGVLLVLAVTHVLRAVRTRASDGAERTPDGAASPSDADHAPGDMTPSPDDGADRAATHPTPRRHLTSAAVCVVVGVVAVLGPTALPLPHADGLDPVANPPVTATVEVPDRAQPVDAGTAVAQSGVLKVGAVQGNVPVIGGTPYENAEGVLTNHLDGTRDLADDVDTRAAAGGDDPRLDVVLWPEDSSGWDPQETPAVARTLDAAAERVGAPILVGAQEFPETGGRWNVMLLWQAGQGVTQRYAKQHPAPFGEFIPWRPFFRLFSDQVDRVTTDMFAATNPPVVDLPSQRLDRDVRLGLAICFEVAYDEILRDAARRGAEVLIVPTNNASFGVTAQSTQQLQMTRMQAIANGRAAVQLSTVGVSGVVAPDGTLVARTGLYTADRLTTLLPLRTTWTPATAAGYWPGWVLSAGGGLLALGGLAHGITRRRRTPSGD